MGNWRFGSRKRKKLPPIEEILEKYIERMRKIHQTFKEQEVHANIGNSNCLISHIACSILYALGNMIENKKRIKNGIRLKK